MIWSHELHTPEALPSLKFERPIPKRKKGWQPMRIRLGAVESRRRDIVHTGKEHVNGSIDQRFTRDGDPGGIGVSGHVNKFDHAPIT